MRCNEKMYEIMRDRWYFIYGGRFSETEFKGCCMALIDSDKVEDRV